MNELASRESGGEFLLYQTEDGQVKLEVRLQNETVWLTQQMIAELFQTTVPNISMHIRNIYAEGELTPEATIKKFLTVRQEGNRAVRRELDYYNLDMIISVGYRVKSLIATRFRIWATHQLKEYIIKGFVMDDERLKNPPVKGSAVPDYFDEMLARIRDIRASERRMYLRVREIFAMAAALMTMDVLPHSNAYLFFDFFEGPIQGFRIQGLVEKFSRLKVKGFFFQLFIPMSGNNYDLRLGTYGFDSSQYGKNISARHLDIGQNDGRKLFFKDFKSRFGIFSSQHPVTASPQKQFHHLKGRHFIINDQNLFHFNTPPRTSRIQKVLKGAEAICPSPGFFA